MLNFKILAGLKVLPPDHPFPTQKYKGFSKFTSCSPVVRALVYQPSGPGFDSWRVSFRVSYYKGKNPNDAAATYLVFVNYILTFMKGNISNAFLIFLIFKQFFSQHRINGCDF
jgi:hypothetical protein